MRTLPHIQSPLIIAHRGASSYAPENTLASIRRAVEIGADGIEFDVQLARDGVPVVVHDETLMRYARRKDRVTELTSRQLGQVDVGSWFNRKYRSRARPEYANETIPTLASVLGYLRDFDGPVYIELKCNYANFRDLTSAVCQVVQDHPRLDRLIVKSFKLAVIPEVRHYLPTIQTAGLFAPEILHFLRRREHIIALAREFGADQLSVHHTLVTPRLSTLAAESGMPLAVWTVDDPKWLHRRRSLEINALITNDPARFVQSRLKG